MGEIPMKMYCPQCNRPMSILGSNPSQKTIKCYCNSCDQAFFTQDGVTYTKQSGDGSK